MNSMVNHLFPHGLESTAQRQLNRMPEPMRPLLVAAAVAGSVVDSALLGQLIARQNYPFSLDEWLIHSVSAAILQIDKDQNRFAEESLRQMLVDALTRDEKISWHQQIVTALETLHKHNPARSAALAYHWQQIGNAEKEKQYARLAAEHACQQYDYDTAVTYLNRALNLTSADDLPGQYNLLLVREYVYHLQGNRDAQKNDLTRLAEIADLLSTGDEQEWRTEVALRLGKFAEVTGEYSAAIVAATEALRLAQTTRVPTHEATSYLVWGQALLRQGKYEEAQEKLQLSQLHAQNHHIPQVAADSLRCLGVQATDLGEFNVAKQYYEEALLLYHKLHDKRGESTVLNNLSIVAYAQNQLVAALDYWEQARLIHLSIKDKEGTARVLSNLSSLCMDLGEYEKGRVYSQDALTICREIDLRFGQGLNLINLSLFSHHLGDEKRTDIYSQAALKLAEEMESLPLMGLALKDRAYIFVQRKQGDEAEQAYQQAKSVWQQQSQSLQLLEVQAGLAKAALLQEDLEKARANIQPVVTHLQSGNTLAGTSRPFYIYLVCYELLAAVQDPYAPIVLKQAYEELSRYAYKITDELRLKSFWQNVKEHRQIRTLFGQLTD
ncbi:tetratricopeptide repeat protein [Candidatus Leptofilum sp.]|uniref:tetratricopeptide repeat protein n=1 Tax=Candidatus Leptofilum sp. TaxID=3241576 RepID=UPI003B59423F